jgi:hypothetical protein
MRAVRSRRWFARVTLAVLLLSAVGYVTRTVNFGAVVPGWVYRSGQMDAGTLTRTLRGDRIKTVLNLRGPNPSRAWYRAELAATAAAGATHVDLAMSSCEWMSRAQLRALVRVLDSCDYPLLIHCEHGSERTGLVAAFSELLRPGATLKDAENQFTIRYLFTGLRDGKVMLRHLEQYESWLLARGEAHTPARFRLWAAEGFTPGTPCREQWPYDPYPLVVVTRPAAGPQAPPLAGAGQRGARR